MRRKSFRSARYACRRPEDNNANAYDVSDSDEERLDRSEYANLALADPIFSVDGESLPSFVRHAGADANNHRQSARLTEASAENFPPG